MIQTKGLTKTFKDLVAVGGIDMEVAEGDVYGFIGPNGAGKTTTLRMLATLLSPTSGDAFVCGYSVVREAKKIRHLIGYMPDFFGVYDDMLVEEYLAFFASSYRIKGEARKKIVADVLELTDLTSKRDAYVRELSRGMQQRLGLARVLIHDPKVLLLDEPASGLDPRARIEIRELIRELRAMGKTIVVSSHILHELGEICNKIGVIERGRLVFQGDISSVLEQIRPRNVFYFQVGGGRNNEAAELLKSSGKITEAEPKGERMRIVLSPEAGVSSAISELLIDKGFDLVYLKEEEVDLEDAFMRLTKGGVS
jgi:ABC-2 type transport system ATP-binding protein